MVEIIGHGTYNFIPFDSDELYNRYVDYHRKHQNSIDPDTVGCIAGSDFTVEDLTNENELCANSFDNGEIFPYIADILNNENKCKGFTAFDAPEGCTEGTILYLPQRDIEDHGTCLKGQAVRDIFMLYCISGIIILIIIYHLNIYSLGTGREKMNSENALKTSIMLLYRATYHISSSTQKYMKSDKY